MPKVSIITPVLNNAQSIACSIESVINQSHPVEHVVIDGGSTDGTKDVIDRYAPCLATVLSEPDRGIYDAMNKGIRLATGDIIGILNSDDFYCHGRVIEKIVHTFETERIDALFADLVYVRPDNLEKVVRYYSTPNFNLSHFAFGMMPAHPTFFVRRECYAKYGLYRTDYKIAADFELVARFLVKHRIPFRYLPEVLITMRTGGASTRNFKSNIILNREILRACAENGIPTNALKVYSKYLVKCLQYIDRPS